ncbi:MAG TPA: cytochrome c maturation protein CcmE [Labilithrix sp.]|nr:cytochrome c maturation protein CcmE [Labilithrix sp.]
MSPYRDDAAPPRDLGIERDHRRRNFTLAFLGGAGTTLALLWMFASTHSSQGARGAVGVDELMAGSKTARVEGDLVPGSLVRQESPCEYRFSLERNGFRIPVRHASCVISDPFAQAAADGDPALIMVEGELEANGFIARSVATRGWTSCLGSREATDELRKARRARAVP